MAFHRALFVSAGVAFAVVGSAAACSAVLGLAAPSLLECTDACTEAGLPPTIEDAGPESDVTAPPSVDAGADAAAADADHVPDAVADVVPDRGSPDGVRCGSGASEIFCSSPARFCCLTLDAGASTYSCAASASDCSGYSIECASDNDCSGSDVCCFYASGIKCEPENTSSCAKALVCDPSAPASENQCNTGQTCSIAWVLDDAGTLPYFGCN